MRLLGLNFRSWREAWEVQCEAVAYGYAEESRQYAEEHRPPTFKDYLIQMRGAGWPMSGSVPARRFAA